MRECLSTNRRLNVHHVADIIIGAAELVREARQKIKYERSHSATQVPVLVRQSMANLSVALWLASCSTPYIKDVSKADGFRPFVAGVLYGTRRGFALDSGVELIPCLPDLAAVLPNLRMASQSSVKNLQASSHRGLCTLQKAVTSLADEETCRSVFASAITIAKTIKQKGMRGL